MMASGLGATDIGEKGTIGGISREVFARIGAKYESPDEFHFEPHVATEVFNEMLAGTHARLFC